MIPNDRYHPPPEDGGDVLTTALSAAQPSTRAEAAVQESIAAAALTAPQHRAPARCLTAIRRRIAAPRALAVNGHANPAPRSKVTAISRLGWGMAAALALLAGWQTVRVIRLKDELIAARNHRSPDKIAGSDTQSGTSSGTAPGAIAAEGEHPLSPGKHRSPFQLRDKAEAILVPDRPALERKLAELQRAQEARLQQSPGMARTTVTELNPPGKTATSARTPALTDEIAEIIAAGMTRTRSGKPFSLSGTDRSRPGGGMVFEEGLPNLSGFTLPQDTTFLHNHFPVENWQDWEGLHLLKDGTYYDELNNLLWKPVSGGRYSGSVPENPIILDEAAAPRDTPAAPPSQSSTGDSSTPLVWSIYDESRGEGRLVISDLPPAPSGKSYQLWFEDPNTTAPVTAGLLPPLENGAGQVWFNLTPGISPTRYRLTLEPAGGSTQPAGPTVLSGP